ncbi:MAG: hypothetical protein LPJ89_11300 [Hymenobacteraceae bacterium]|nr:hypothetical protein [Hymenobacteraceae bacterium]MDX5396328.1 hypothetical protein [Hymenobacteraceae bacterium]MDX5444353.1 hypothetical protein [Hymenobacteraceae bacterium]MDX5512388.1 hypothetical protein [Hymenobacteraceae bacterium]
MLKTRYLLIAALAACAACDNATQNSETIEVTETTATPPDTVVGRPLPPDSTLSHTDVVSEEDFMIFAGKAGRVSVGMPASDLEKAYPATQLNRTTKQQEGIAYTVYEILAPGTKEVLMEAEMDCSGTCKVWRIQVKSPKFRTDEGLGVNSTFRELQEAYSINVATGEGNIVAIANDKKLSFLLKAPALKPVKGNDLKPKDIPAGTKVIGVLVL